MVVEKICLDCGAPLVHGETCETNFHQMLFWENEFPEYGEQVHHLMVLCYHLQHPSLFSPQGLSFGKELLRKFVRDGIKPHEIRLQLADEVNSSRRQWKIRGTPGQPGTNTNPIRWGMTTADIMAGGHENYCKNVEHWADAILLDLEQQV